MRTGSLGSDGVVPPVGLEPHGVDLLETDGAGAVAYGLDPFACFERVFDELMRDESLAG